MSKSRKPKTNPETALQKELRRIRNILMLLAMKSGANATEVDYATGIGAGNIRAMFPVSRGKKSKK